MSQLSVAALSKGENLAILKNPSNSLKAAMVSFTERSAEGRTIVNTAVCASPQLMKVTPRGLRAGTMQTLKFSVDMTKNV